jgi:integrase/recombinase XerD
MLTPAEVKRIIDAASNSRDRALVSTQYKGGLRIGEIGNLQWKLLHFSEWSVTSKINFKTGKQRHVPLVTSMPYLKALANDMGECPTEGFVFLTTRGNHFNTRM